MYRGFLKNLDKWKYLILSSIIILFMLMLTVFYKSNDKIIKKSKIFEVSYERQDLKKFKEFIFKQIKSPFTNLNYEIKKGDSVQKILNNYKINKTEVQTVINQFKKYANPSQLLVGNTIDIIFKKNATTDKNSIIKFSIPVTKSTTIEISKNEDNKIIANKIITKLYKRKTLSENIIKKNLYSSATEVGINPDTMIEFARIFGFEIDFQRDIRKNDYFKILYENYFDSNGKSVEKALMKTPINGARLSSPFGKRKHPITGFTKIHQGTDFAAPMGTPIMASGSGTVTRAKWCGGGGNCIKIKHNSTYETIYAHMKSFAKGMKVGKKVRQGQIIGYVGSTGMSTGPHLHYEVVVNGKKVNSQRLKLPSGKILKDEERKQFEIHRIKTDVLIAELIDKKN